MNDLSTTQKTTPNALTNLAERLSVSPQKLESTLKATVFKNCRNNEEFAVMVAVSNEYELNPLIKQIYAFPAKGGGVEPIVSIDGWLKIINSQINFDGMEVSISDDGEEATCKIFVKGRSHPTIITEYKSECYRNTEPWNKMPKRMLRHKSIMQCGRVAFGISGIYDEDEGRDAGFSPRNVTPEPAKVEPFKDKSEASKSLVNSQESGGKTDETQVAVEAEVVTEEKPQEKPRQKYDLTVSDVTTEEGTREGGQKWTRYDVALTDGKKSIVASTFSKTKGEIAIFNKGMNVVVTLSKSEHGFQLDSLELPENPTTEGGIC